jgi:hypothetical protein
MAKSVTLEFKPDFEEAKRHWAAFWAKEIIDRPCIYITAPKEGVEQTPGPPYMAGNDGNFDEPIARVVEKCSQIFWGGDAVPNYNPSFGPDQFAAFLGADLKISRHSTGTSWAVPFVEDWESVLPLKLKPQNAWWKRMLEFVRRLAKATEGKLVIGHLDTHSNMDALSAIRNPQRLCEDLIDCPDLIDRAMRDVRAIFPKFYDAIYKAGDMDRRGSSSWIPIYGEGKAIAMQCDFCCMVGPEMFRRFILPALEEEASYTDHSIYHYDGPGALVHLQDILAIKDLGAIQWVQGAGNKPFIEWMDLLKEIQKAGKAVWVPCSPEELRVYHRELKPELVFYVCGARTEAEARETLDWLVRNT